MRKFLVAALALLSTHALAFDPPVANRYPSPDLYRPNVDSLIIRGDGTTGNLSGASVQPEGSPLKVRLDRLLGRRKNVADFPGWDPTGATDSTSAIQAAINALPASGGVVEVPCGSTPKITSTLNIHNGSASAYTTRNGTQFEATCAAPSSWSFSGAVPTASVPNKSMQIKWAGAAGGTMMQVNGGDGWGVRDVVFDCGNIAGVGLKVVSASSGDSRRLSGLNCTNTAFLSTTVPGIAVGGNTYKADSLRNHYTQIYALLADGGRGIVLDGDRTSTGASASDTDFNLWENVQVQDKGVNGSTPGAILFGQSDSNIIRNLQCTLANSYSTCIGYDTTGSQNGGILPGSNLVDFVDWGGIPTNPVKVTEASGATLQGFNFITNILHVNGGDTRIHLHPKIFMSDNSVSITNEGVQGRSVSLKQDGTIAANLYNEGGVWKYQGNGPGMYWDFHSNGGFFSTWMAGINGNGAGFPATGLLTESERIYSNGFRQFLADISVPTIRTAVYTVAGLPACTAGAEGQRASVSDALNPTWNGALVGGGTGEAAHSGARCNGTRWVGN